MQPSEMTNEELAFYIVNTIGGGIFKEYYAEVAERLRKLKVAEDALEKCVNYNNSWELEAAKENAKNALAVIRGKGGEMSLDVAIQTFQSQKDSVLWRSLDDNGIVKYYYAEDCVYVLKFGMTYAFVKAKSPRLAWRKFCKDRDKALGIKKGSNND